MEQSRQRHRLVAASFGCNIQIWRSIEPSNFIDYKGFLGILHNLPSMWSIKDRPLMMFHRSGIDITKEVTKKTRSCGFLRCKFRLGMWRCCPRGQTNLASLRGIPCKLIVHVAEWFQRHWGIWNEYKLHIQRILHCCKQAGDLHTEQGTPCCSYPRNINGSIFGKWQLVSFSLFLIFQQCSVEVNGILAFGCIMEEFFPQLLPWEILHGQKQECNFWCSARQLHLKAICLRCEWLYDLVLDGHLAFHIFHARRRKPSHTAVGLSDVICPVFRQPLCTSQGDQDIEASTKRPCLHAPPESKGWSFQVTRPFWQDQLGWANGRMLASFFFGGLFWKITVYHIILYHHISIYLP